MITIKNSIMPFKKLLFQPRRLVIKPTLHRQICLYSQSKYSNNQKSYQNRTYDKSQNYKRQQRDTQMTPNYNVFVSVGPEYWQKLFEQIEPDAQQLIKLFLNPNSSQNQTVRALQHYLQFRNFTFQKGIRSDLGCIGLLVAMNMAPAKFSFEEYESRIIDFLTLSDIHNSKYDTVMLRCFIVTLHKRTLSNVQKNIRQYYRLKYVELVMQNFQNLDDKDLSLVIGHVQEVVQKDSYNFITKWRFYPLFAAIQSRTISLMKEYMSESSNASRKQEIQTLLNPYYLTKYLFLINIYESMTAQEGQIFYQYFTQRDELKRQDFHFFKVLMSAFIKIPYIQLDKQRLTLREKFFMFFEDRYNQSASFRSIYISYSIIYKRYIIQKFIEDQFHKTFKQLNFENVDNTFHYLEEKSLKKPVVNDMIWRFFKLDESKILQKNILNQLMYTIYPQKLSKSSLLTPIGVLNERTIVSIDNESNLKIWQALKNLGYKFKKQQLRAQRHVDIIIDDHIIIQIDGESHYSYLTKQLIPSTSFRNLHLLLSGYKLLIISMFEYNSHRTNQQFEQLLKTKLEILNRPGVVYVS